jgi:hypothetical protein
MATHKTAKQIEDEVAKQNAATYGDEAPGGHMASPESDDDIEEVLAETFGDDAAEESFGKRKPFNMADEMNEDEQGAGGHISDAESKELIKKDKKAL